MSPPAPAEDCVALGRHYRGLTETEIRARLDGALADAERAVAKAELLRRGIDDADAGPDTGAVPTSLFDVESRSESEPESGGGPGPGTIVAVLLVLVCALALLTCSLIAGHR